MYMHTEGINIFSIKTNIMKFVGIYDCMMANDGMKTVAIGS